MKKLKWKTFALCTLTNLFFGLIVMFGNPPFEGYDYGLISILCISTIVCYAVMIYKVHIIEKKIATLIYLVFATNCSILIITVLVSSLIIMPDLQENFGIGALIITIFAFVGGLVSFIFTFLVGIINVLWLCWYQNSAMKLQLN